MIDHPHPVPGVNKLGKYGRWASAEFMAVYEIEKEFDTLIDSFIADPSCDNISCLHWLHEVARESDRKTDEDPGVPRW
ncbi:MAG: hypothetical protein ACREWG_12410 [Gammaproteobacteria bacterium]